MCVPAGVMLRNGALGRREWLSWREPRSEFASDYRQFSITAQSDKTTQT